MGDGKTIRCFRFLDDTWEEIVVEAGEASLLEGHGGGDEGLMDAFIDAVRHGDPGRVLSGPEETLETHRMAFAAERSRIENRVITLDVPSLPT